MQRRIRRATVLTLLLVSALPSAYFLWNIERRSGGRIAAKEDVAAHLLRMADTITGIGAAQKSYVAPGQLDEPWFERTSALVDQLSADIEKVGTNLRSP